MKRTPLKKGSNQLKKSSSLKKSGKIGIKPKSLNRFKPKTEEQKKANLERWEKDKEFYQHIWNTRPHYCACCGIWLGNELKTIFCDHLIEKSTHPELRYEPDNLLLVCATHHSEKTNGFPHPKHKKAIEEAKRKFI